MTRHFGIKTYFALALGLLFVTLSVVAIALVNSTMRRLALNDAEYAARMLLDHNLLDQRRVKREYLFHPDPETYLPDGETAPRARTVDFYHYPFEHLDPLLVAFLDPLMNSHCVSRAKLREVFLRH